MFLSRIALDGNKRDVMRALKSPSIFHGGIENCFSEERQRNLWRIDSLNNKLYLLILSPTRPELSLLCNQFGIDGSEGEIRLYDRFLEKIHAREKLHFRITANPTKASKTDVPKGSRGKITALVTVDEQKEWLISKAEKNGFALPFDSFDVVQKSNYCFYKNQNRKVTLTAVSYEGILEVKNTEQFRKALEKGIGRGKAYGMGLLTVMHIEGSTYG